MSINIYNAQYLVEINVPKMRNRIILYLENNSEMNYLKLIKNIKPVLTKRKPKI